RLSGTPGSRARPRRRRRSFALASRRQSTLGFQPVVEILAMLRAPPHVDAAPPWGVCGACRPPCRGSRINLYRLLDHFSRCWRSVGRERFWILFSGGGGGRQGGLLFCL